MSQQNTSTDFEGLFTAASLNSLLSDENALALIIDSLPAMVTYVDCDQRFRFVNSAVEARFSRSRNEIIGKHLADVIPARGYEILSPWFAKALSGEAVKFEMEYEDDEGQAQAFRVQYVPHRDAQGGVRGIYGLIEDNTELNNTIGALKEAISETEKKEQNLADAQRVANIGSWERRFDTGWLYWSEQVFHIFGLAPTRGVMSPDEFRSHVHPDDLDNLNRDFSAALESGNTFDLVHRIIRPDGVVRCVHELASVVWDDEGKVIRVIGTVQDVSEQMMAEQARDKADERLASLVENALEAIITVDGHHEITLFNGGAEAIFGYKAEEMMGANIKVLIPERFHRRHDVHVDSFVASSYRQNHMSARTDVVAKRKDGSEFPAEASISKLEVGADLEFTVMLRDVSEQREREERLRQSQRLEAVGLLTGGIAHDFNNLLTAILGNLELLKMNSSLDEQAREMVETALQATERGAETTDQLLTFSKQQPTSSEIADVKEILEELKKLMRHLVDSTVQKSISTADDLWPAKADPTQLQNAILNLIINARDAMPLGGNLAINAENKSVSAGEFGWSPDLTAGDYIEISVADSGTGITPDALAHVFEPFFTTKGVDEGSGLGLSMVFGFVEQSDGAINIESEEGVGTTVTIYLPANVEATD